MRDLCIPAAAPHRIWPALARLMREWAAPMLFVGEPRPLDANLSQDIGLGRRELWWLHLESGGVAPEPADWLDRR